MVEYPREICNSCQSPDCNFGLNTTVGRPYGGYGILCRNLPFVLLLGLILILHASVPFLIPILLCLYVFIYPLITVPDLFLETLCELKGFIEFNCFDNTIGGDFDFCRLSAVYNHLQPFLCDLNLSAIDLLSQYVYKLSLHMKEMVVVSGHCLITYSLSVFCIVMLMM